MSAIDYVSALFLKPFNSSVLDKCRSIPEKASCFDSIKARLYFVAQVIASVIALPIILILGIFTSLIHLVQCKSLNPICTQLKESFKFHALMAIPISLIGIFAPLTTTRNFGNSLDACLMS
jgi:hypothetical protein